MKGTSNLAAAAAALAMLLAVAPARAAPCWAPQTAKAAKIRDFQTYLMVGALQCRGTNVRVLSDYNTFVRNHRTGIAAQNDKLRVHFIGMHGKRAGERAYDRFTTALANDQSSRAQAADYCLSVAEAAARAAAARPADLERLADMQIDDTLGVSACNRTRIASSRG